MINMIKQNLKYPKTKQNIEGTKVFRQLDSDEPIYIKPINFNIKEKIKNTRLLLGITQKDLAKKINVKYNLINDYENGIIIPDKKILQKISSILNIKL